MARNNGIRNVLVSRFSALGDVAMVIPVLYDVCRSNPSDHFIFITKQHPAKLFVNAPSNLSVTGIDTAEYSGIGGIRRLARELQQKYAITDYIDLHDVLRTKLLRLFLRTSGVRVKHLAKGRMAKKAMTRRLNKVLLPLPSTPARYADAFRRGGFHREETFHSIFPTGSVDLLPSEFKNQTREVNHRIAIAPFARHKGKVYPLELMKEVVDNYVSRGDNKIFIFGAGEEEANKIDILCDGHPQVENMARKNLGIAAELELLSLCDVMLSMDSANMHMASLVGLPAVTVWGATHPYCGFLGWRQREEDTVQLDMVCRPCSVFGDKPCRRGDYHCMHGIAPKRIIAKIDDILRR